ncbi:hypothetical protein FVE85_7247 [Porphyridium purpureum]|uniref:Uncharacterized protein n=1 Tax=Porphyridium purpureum TaxID=35688 RepID=A0A5J4Z9B1_PORPP|nr:hypothetical protein FVE85_7247 [Porphyridium purpureum]|eukprot:POR5803..scf295_1
MDVSSSAAAAAATSTPSAQVEEGVVLLSAPQRSHAFVHLFRSVLQTAGAVSKVRASAQSTDVIQGPMSFAFELQDKSKAQACADALTQVYAGLPPVSLIDVERALSLPSDKNETILDMESYAVFVDNSAQPVMDYHHDLRARRKRYQVPKVLDVLEEQHLIVRFVNVNVANGVQLHTIHVLNGHGDQLDESHRRRLNAILYRALSGAP